MVERDTRRFAKLLKRGGRSTEHQPIAIPERVLAPMELMGALDSPEYTYALYLACKLSEKPGVMAAGFDTVENPEDLSTPFVAQGLQHLAPLGTWKNVVDSHNEPETRPHLIRTSISTAPGSFLNDSAIVPPVGMLKALVDRPYSVGLYGRFYPNGTSLTAKLITQPTRIPTDERRLRTQMQQVGDPYEVNDLLRKNYGVVILEMNYAWYEGSGEETERLHLVTEPGGEELGMLPPLTLQHPRPKLHLV